MTAARASFSLLTALSIVVGGGGCGDDPTGTLLVDLRTDLVPEIEFTQVEVTLAEGSDTSERRTTTDADATTGFREGARVAELRGLARGRLSLVVRVLDAGRLVAARRVTVDLDSDQLAVTVVITRACAGVVCPAMDGDPAATECLANECVVPACTSVEDDACGFIRTCDTPADCTLPAACAEPACIEGVCFGFAGECPAGQYCAPQTGCVDVDRPDGGPRDGGPADGGAGDASPGPDCMRPGASGPLVSYSMDGSGTVVEPDRAARPPDVPLAVDPARPEVAYSGSGTVQLTGGHLVANLADSTALTTALEGTGALTVEVWLATAVADQNGPARIVSLSRDAFGQAFMIGQDDDALSVRLRTTVTNDTGDGFRGLVADVFPTTAPQHVVITFEPTTGQLRTFVGGTPEHVVTHVGADGTTIGALRFAARGDRLGMGNEFVDPRPWIGEIFRAAIWDRALTDAEIACLADGGPDGP